MKKIFSVLMAILLVLAAAPLSTFAGAEDVAAFSVNLESETEEKAVITVILESGGFKALDLRLLYNSEKITGCSKAKACTAIALLSVEGENASQAIEASTGRYSVAVEKGFSVAGTVLATYTLDKVEGVEISKEDIVLEAENWADVTGIVGTAEVINNIPEIVLPPDPFKGTCGDNLSWAFNQETGELVISGTGKMTSYSADSPAPWDEYKAQIKKLTVSEGVTTIGNDTFTGCENLEEVSLPDTLTKIGDSAFRDCAKLADIKIPDEIKSIGHYAFYGCSGLTELRLGNGVKTIGNYAFRKCGNIKLVIMPDTLTSIGKGAFADCPSIAYAAFKGTAEQWSAVSVGANNEALLSALIRFGNDNETGDINGDKNINSMDALYCLQHSTQVVVLMDDAFAMGDINGDGKINSFDALLILEYCVGEREAL